MDQCTISQQLLKPLVLILCGGSYSIVMSRFSMQSGFDFLSTSNSAILLSVIHNNMESTMLHCWAHFSCDFSKTKVGH